MRILVALPVFDGWVSTETYSSLWRLREASREHRLFLQFVRGYTVDKARNEIGRMAEGYDAVLMVDSDIVLPENALAYMASPEADIVLGAYPRKRGRKGLSSLIRYGAKDCGVDAAIGMDEVKRACGRIPVKGGGLGCALIKAPVFARLEYPWFRYVENEDGSHLSEDYYFCNKAAEQGFDIQADCRVQCGHVWEAVHWD